MTDHLNDLSDDAEIDSAETGIEDPNGEPFDAEEEEEEEEQEQEQAGSSAPARRPRLTRTRAALGSKAFSVTLVVLLIATGGLATWLYFKQFRPDQQTDPGVARAVAGTASDGTAALLSYSSDTLDQDFATARSYLGGDFLSYYNDFTKQVVTPAAKQKSLKTTARVTGAAVTELRPYSAVVLVFVDQTTKIKDNPQPSLALSSALVRMSRINGKWLITKFTPV